MKNKKILAMVLVLSMVLGLAACGKQEPVKEAVTNIEKTDVVEVEEVQEVQEEVQEEQQEEEVHKEQQEEQPQPAKAENSKGNSNAQQSTNVPVNHTTQPSVAPHEHTWKQEEKTYELIKTYVNGCNGCGYPLFTITEKGTEHIENLYFHPACYSEKLQGDCTGGGFHNESYTSGYCYYCGGKVSYRQCMWTEMGKRCAKNEALGAYEKVIFDQNHFMYLDACDCGKDWIVVDGSTNEGLIIQREVCTTCGEVKE